MRAIATVILVLLAGCSADGGPEPASGSEAPIAGADEAKQAQENRARQGEPEVFEIKDSGTMLYGVDESWTFDVEENATQIHARITAVPIEGNRHLSALDARAEFDGQVYQDGSISGSHGSFGGAPPLNLVEVDEAAGQDGNLTALQGTWRLVLQGENQLADYEISVRVVY